MSSPNPVLSTLIFVFAFQAMVLSVLLVSKRPARQSNIFLALLVFFFALMAFNIALINAFISNDVFHLYRYFQLELMFGIGPALFLYTKSITDPQFRFSRKYYLHFVPVVLEFIFYRTAFYRLGADGMYTTPNHPYTKIYLTEQWLGILSISIYTILSLLLLYRHQVSLKQHYSNLKNRSLNWLKIPVLFYAAFWIFWNLLTEVDRFLFDRELKASYFLPTFVGLAIASCWIGFKGYMKSQIESHMALKNLHKNDQTIDPALGRKIVAVMDKEKPYLDPELDLTSLAYLLEMSPKQVSRVINQVFKMNFYEYINRYRIEAFKKRIETPGHQKLTLLGHAYACGFKSKSTFNHVFKKMVGKTPSRYLKQLQNRSE